MFNEPTGLSMAMTGVPQGTALERETRAALPTPEAAWHLSRAEQTLRLWACRDNGPIRPIRLNGRLLWPTSKLRELLGVAE
jgi:hypothetical protein